MRKVSFMIGERVNVIQDNKIVTGVIRKIYAEVVPPVFMVDIDGEISKVEIDKIAKIQEEPKEEERPIKEKEEITITPKEFSNIAMDVIKSEVEDRGPGGAILGMAFTVFVAKLHTALFVDEAE